LLLLKEDLVRLVVLLPAIADASHQLPATALVEWNLIVSQLIRYRKLLVTLDLVIGNLATFAEVDIRALELANELVLRDLVSGLREV
jgi:hypothetical protein